MSSTFLDSILLVTQAIIAILNVAMLIVLAVKDLPDLFIFTLSHIPGCISVIGGPSLAVYAIIHWTVRRCMPNSEKMCLWSALCALSSLSMGILFSMKLRSYYENHAFLYTCAGLHLVNLVIYTMHARKSS